MPVIFVCITLINHSNVLNNLIFIDNFMEIGTIYKKNRGIEKCIQTI